MSKLIINPNENPVQPAFDPYWDKPMTRREAHVLFMKLASNDNELTGMADTASILINFLCEKLEVKREDVESYVARKHVELEAMRKNLADAEQNPEQAQEQTQTQPVEAAQGQATDAQSNS